MGAGVLPFCVHEGEVNFLFQKVFSGRKVGHLIDFGGGVGEGESYREAAIREFVEETETMFFADDPATASRAPERVAAQIPLVAHLFDRTLNEHPEWWCRRAPGDKPLPKDWLTYFIEFDFRELDSLNREWELEGGRRLKKRRELLWLPADELLDLYDRSPERLWKRIRELIDFKPTIQSIRQDKAS